jgi:alpha-beta hydrolase superfamily lysophospholipase
LDYTVYMPESPPQIETYRATDGRLLQVRKFGPTDNSRAQVVLLHGIISHGGWYTRGCNHLANAGFAVHFLDRRGSGLDAEARGDVDRWETWLSDVEVYLEHLRGNGPVVVCGISWGGKLAPALARHRPDLMAGIGLICPGIYARQQPGPLKRGALAATGALGINEKRIPIPLQEAELFTDTPQWQEYIRHDPLTLREITLRFARADRLLTRHVRQSGPWIHTPTLLMLAGREEIVDNRRTRKFFNTLAARDKTLIDYPNAAHTLEFEPDPVPYLNDLARWIEKVATA